MRCTIKQVQRLSNQAVWREDYYSLSSPMHADDLVSGAKLTLSFEDVSGKQYYATMVTSRDKETGPRYEPGLSIEVIPKE